MPLYAISPFTGSIFQKVFRSYQSLAFRAKPTPPFTSRPEETFLGVLPSVSCAKAAVESKRSRNATFGLPKDSLNLDICNNISEVIYLIRSFFQYSFLAIHFQILLRHALFLLLLSEQIQMYSLILRLQRLLLYQIHFLKTLNL